MSQEPTDYGAEVRDTVVKSSLCGVAATVLAVTIFSPAALGGIIGTSIAAGFGMNPGTTPGDDVYANLPPFPSPLSQVELDEIRGQLAQTEASLAITRAATEAKIERMRSLAISDDMVTFTPMASVGTIAAIPAPQPVEQMTAQAPVQLEPVRDSHLELAALLLAHENI